MPGEALMERKEEGTDGRRLRPPAPPTPSPLQAHPLQSPRGKEDGSARVREARSGFTWLDSALPAPTAPLLPAPASPGGRALRVLYSAGGSQEAGTLIGPRSVSSPAAANQSAPGICQAGPRMEVLPGPARRPRPGTGWPGIASGERLLSMHREPLPTGRGRLA